MPSLKEMLAAKPAPATPAATAATSSAGAAPAAPVIRPPSTTPPSTPAKVEPRPLGEPSAAAADVPFEFASEKSSEAAKLWLAARQVPSSQLGIYIEPGETSAHAWLALDLPEDRGRLILLHRLPLLFLRDGAAPF